MESNKKSKFRSGDEDDGVVECSTKNNNQSLITLSNDLIMVQILPRLPVKSLLRAKSVCKEWYFTITSQEFARNHFEFSSRFPRFLLYLLHDFAVDIRLDLLPYDECSTEVKDLVPLHRAREPVFVVVGCINGLLCLYLQEDEAFSIWNPATLQHQLIPRIAEVADSDVAIAVDISGFGYVSSTDDYKILAMYTLQFQEYSYQFYLFSLKAGSWKRLYSLDGSYISGNWSGFFVDDALYWPTQATRSRVTGILKFNLLDEKTEDSTGIGWPALYESLIKIWKIKGYLSFCGFNDDGRVYDVWTMKKRNGVSGYWEKLWSIDASDMSVLGFTENGKHLVHHNDQLKLLEPSLKGADRCKQGSDYEGEELLAFNYVESVTSIRIGSNLDENKP